MFKTREISIVESEREWGFGFRCVLLSKPT
jgi:hypothetical protein